MERGWSCVEAGKARRDGLDNLAPADGLSSASSASDASSSVESDEDEEGADEWSRPRPWTVRLIDFAHTSLVQGEGIDHGFLKGLETLLRLTQGRIAELEKSLE